MGVERERVGGCVMELGQRDVGSCLLPRRRLLLDVCVVMDSRW